MEKKVAIGIQDFTEIRERNYFYVDKTAFIKEWWESGDKVTLITRPRRFGKTLNMSTLEQFFSLKYENRGELFEGLSIWQEEKYRTLQGTYPVIALSFARVKETSFEATSYRIRKILMKQYKEYAFIQEGDVLSQGEKKDFERMMDGMSELEASDALYQLSDYLYRYYQKKVIILLDEYDTPMQEAWLGGFWEEIVFFMRNLFHSTFKTNPYLERAVMAGITRVSKESVFSDLNHLRVVTTTSSKYATAFGFTQEEVFTALEECGLGEKKECVKQWYDGFTFGEYTDIYNPWSIINFLSDKKLGNYWANTSSNGLVSRLIREGDSRVKEDMEVLLKGGSIRCILEEQIVYEQLMEGREAVWSLLVASGYLKVLKVEDFGEADREGRKPWYELALTNREVYQVFRSLVSGWFGTTGASYNEFIRGLLLKDVDAMNEYMNRVSLQIFSTFDTGNRPSGAEPERFYHGFVLGLMVDMQKDYILTSNKESGFGRYDVMLEPRDKNKDAFILEFKVHNPRREKTLEETVEAALAQIKEKQYETVLITRGIRADQIYKYGLAFEGKKVLIG